MINPATWFVWVLGFTAAPYALLAAYRYMGGLFRQL